MSCSDLNQIDIVQGQDKVFYVDLFYKDTQEPFDLTGVSEIVASFPATISGTTVEEKYTLSGVAVVGAAGGGKISVTCPAADTAKIRQNTAQLQDLQINVTVSSKLSIFILQAVLNIMPPSYTVT